MSFKCSFTSHKLGNNYCIINIMALIAIIIFSLTALIGRVVFHYKLTGTSGIKFERKSLSSASFSIYSILVSVGFYGIVILSILDVLGKFNAQFNLGVSYINGMGIPQNNVNAYMWLLLARAQGHQKAAEYTDSIKTHLTAADLSKAQRLATEWWEKHNN